MSGIAIDKLNLKFIVHMGLMILHPALIFETDKGGKVDKKELLPKISKLDGIILNFCCMV